MGKYLYPRLAVTVPSPGSGDETSWSKFAGRDELSKIHPIEIKSVPPSHTTFKPRLRIWNYADLAFPVSSPGLGKVAIPDQIY